MRGTGGSRQEFADLSGALLPSTLAMVLKVNNRPAACLRLMNEYMYDKSSTGEISGTVGGGDGGSDESISAVTNYSDFLFFQTIYVSTAHEECFLAENLRNFVLPCIQPLMIFDPII